MAHTAEELARLDCDELVIGVLVPLSVLRDRATPLDAIVEMITLNLDEPVASAVARWREQNELKPR